MLSQVCVQFHTGNQYQPCETDKEASVVDNCLERMLKAGLLGIQLLPRTALKGWD